MIAIIGGSGVYDPKMLENVRDITVETEYGAVTLKSGTHQGKTLFFLTRHGEKHSVPPHMVNYRANIKALHQLKVERIIATSAVGSLRKEMSPGDFVLLDQFLDFTKGRMSTFFDKKVVHTDVTHPYCSQLRDIISQAVRALGITIHPEGTYVCAEGPRFETAAEIEMFALLGGDVVGMTSVPEVVLARELKMCYATVATVTNFAAGITPSKITHKEVIEIMDRNSENIKKLITQVIETIPEKKTCECGD